MWNGNLEIIFGTWRGWEASSDWSLPWCHPCWSCTTAASHLILTGLTSRKLYLTSLPSVTETCQRDFYFSFFQWVKSSPVGNFTAWMVYTGNMQQVDLYYVQRKTCQTRWQKVFDGFGQTRGVKPGEVRGKYWASQIDFDTESGASMFCAARCSATDLALCSHKKLRGTCNADSGCNY